MEFGTCSSCVNSFLSPSFKLGKNFDLTVKNHTQTRLEHTFLSLNFMNRMLDALRISATILVFGNNRKIFWMVNMVGLSYNDSSSSSFWFSGDTTTRACESNIPAFNAVFMLEEEWKTLKSRKLQQQKNRWKMSYFDISPFIQYMSGKQQIDSKNSSDGLFKSNR